MSDAIQPVPDNNQDPDHSMNAGERQGKSPGIIVIAIGLVTAAITLFGVNLLNKTDFNIMGLYILAIIPVGAILVGLVAGSGYAIGSWATGAKIGGGLLVLVVLLQILSYFGFQYLDYRNARQQIIDHQVMEIEQIRNNEIAGADQMPDEMKEQFIKNIEAEQKKDLDDLNFIKYFDADTRSWAFDGGNQLGVWGYGIRLLEILGFSLGGLIVPLILAAQPYCADCQVYKKTKQLGTMPAGVMPRKVKRKDTEGQENLQNDMQEALDGGFQLVEESIEMATSENATEFCDLLKEFNAQKKEINKQTSRIEVSMQHCPGCAVGTLVYTMQTGHGEDVVTEVLAHADVSPQFVRHVKVTL